MLRLIIMLILNAVMTAYLYFTLLVNESASDCSFDHGLCHWKVNTGYGNLHWIWHSPGEEHYQPLSLPSGYLTLR